MPPVNRGGGAGDKVKPAFGAKLSTACGSRTVNLGSKPACAVIDQPTDPKSTFARF
jgi:hypothetical protein